MLASPISRIGGKYFLKNWLSEMIPSHVLYCEPFVGAGHLLFTKSLSQVEVINDIDGHLIAFFQVIKDHEKRQKLIETLEYMPYSRALWQSIRSKWKAVDLPEDEIEQVSQWFYLNRTCFSGDQKRGGFAVPSTTGRNPVQSLRNTIDSLNDIAERLRNVCIENLDYTDCIQRYDSENTLFYCDPPYLDTEHYYGKDSFSQDDHRTLAELLSGARGRAMISHYQNSLYDELYQGWNRFEYSSFKGSHKSTGESKPVTKETLYTNFESETRGLFQ
ncbi:MAG: DNA adenine methylase [Planctomycetes bacterium]|nr:DNA adenine methylase [Planctomycetota bacterium]